MILLLPFLILGEKEVPRRGMSGKEGLWEPSHKKGSLGAESLPLTPSVCIRRHLPQ